MGLLGSLTFAFILETFQNYKMTAIWNLRLQTISITLFFLALESRSKILLSIASILLGFFMTGFQLIGNEYAVELTFPESSFVSGILNISGYCFGILLTLVIKKIQISFTILTGNLVSLKLKVKYENQLEDHRSLYKNNIIFIWSNPFANIAFSASEIKFIKQLLSLVLLSVNNNFLLQCFSLLLMIGIMFVSLTKPNSRRLAANLFIEQSTKESELVECAEHEEHYYKTNTEEMLMMNDSKWMHSLKRQTRDWEMKFMWYLLTIILYWILLCELKINVI